MSGVCRRVVCRWSDVSSLVASSTPQPLLRAHHPSAAFFNACKIRLGHKSSAAQALSLCTALQLALHVMHTEHLYCCMALEG